MQFIWLLTLTAKNKEKNTGFNKKLKANNEKEEKKWNYKRIKTCKNNILVEFYVYFEIAVIWEMNGKVGGWRLFYFLCQISLF